MCFSSPKVPDAQPIPIAAAAPSPTVSPSEVSPQVAGEVRRKRIEQLRYGFASTIKTGGQGIVGTGPELSPTGTTTQGKTKLG